MLSKITFSKRFIDGPLKGLVIHGESITIESKSADDLTGHCMDGDWITRTDFGSDYIAFDPVITPLFQWSFNNESVDPEHDESRTYHESSIDLPY